MRKWQKETIEDVELGDSFRIISGKLAGRTVYTVANKTDETVHCTTNSRVIIRIFWELEWGIQVKVI